MAIDMKEQSQPEAPDSTNEEPSLGHFLDSFSATFRAAGDQFKGLGELASMELDLAVSSLQWWIWALALFFVSTIVAATFLISAILIGITGASLSPAAAMLVMGGVSACAAVFFFFCLRYLSQRMTFRNLRKHLLPAEGSRHVRTKQ